MIKIKKLINKWNKEINKNLKENLEILSSCRVAMLSQQAEVFSVINRPTGNQKQKI